MQIRMRCSASISTKGAAKMLARGEIVDGDLKLGGQSLVTYLRPDMYDLVDDAGGETHPVLEEDE